MTTKEKLHNMLVSNGMFPQQADEVMALAIPKLEAVLPDYRITWDRPATEYPDQMYALWYMTVKECALEWIDTNLPNAWYRPMFV